MPIHELIEQVLGRHRANPLPHRAEIRRVLDRHRGAKTVVAHAVTPRPVTPQAVSQWLAGRCVSRPIWVAAAAIAAELVEREAAELANHEAASLADKPNEGKRSFRRSPRGAAA